MPPPPPPPHTLPPLPAAQAAWLYRATGEEPYLAAAHSYLKRAQASCPPCPPACRRCALCTAALMPAHTRLLPPSLPPLQYQRNYFVSWDGVFVASDALLLSLGVGPSEGVDSAWQMAAFVDTWTKGRCGVGWEGAEVGRCCAGGSGDWLPVAARADGAIAAAVLPPPHWSQPCRPPLQARTACPSLLRAWPSPRWVAGATTATRELGARGRGK